MNQKVIVAIVTVLIGLMIPAYFLISGGNASTDVVVASIPNSDAEVVFVNLASQLVPLSYDTSILSDPRFTSLVDLHTAILPEQKGRRDPFANY